MLGNDDTSKKFKYFLKNDISRIKEVLLIENDIVDLPLVTSMEKARQVAKQCLCSDLDAVVFCCPVWTEDEYLLAFKDVIQIKPSIIWGYTPYKKPPVVSDIMSLFENSGIVGTFEGFNVIVKMQVKPFYVFGSVQDQKTILQINKIIRSAKVYNLLKTAKLGILPYRNFQMIVTYVDEFRLYSQIGPVVEYISCLELKKAIDLISEKEISKFVNFIKSNFKIDKAVSEENLYKSAKAALGFEKIIFEKKLNGIALSDLIPELHEVVGLRPCLYTEKLAKSNVVVGNEGDLGATTGMLILQRLTNSPVMFTEIFNIDYKENIVVAGHAGPSNYLSAEDTKDIVITPDLELMNATTNINGVWMEFIGKPGRVTILNFICTLDNFQMTILGGQSLGGKKRLEGYPHYSIKLDTDLKNFLYSNAENGTSHHWLVVNGDIKEELLYLADLLKVKKVVL